MPSKKTFDLDKMVEEFKKAKPLKVSELYILGILSFKDSSGYDIYKLISQKSEGAGTWLRLNKATTYNTINRMCDDGLIEIKKIVQDPKRPTKSIYKLTPKGKDYLHTMILDYLSGPPWVFVNFTLPLRFCKVLTKKELLEVIHQKIQQLEAILQFNNLTYGKFFSGTILELMQENLIQLYEVELKFLKKLQTELQTKSINDLYKINEFDIDEIMEKVKKLAQEEA
ncbi:PadR family transcriptional regulator [[Eubacterium] cellulosolvens]